MDDLIYPAATALFILNALIMTLILPIMGGISGLTILIILLVKLIIGNQRKKLEQKIGETVGKFTSNKEQGEQMANQATQEASKKASQKIAKQVSSKAAKSNWVTMLIDYLTTPMNRFEKGILLLGWVLWPIFFPLTTVIIIMMLRDACTFIGINWCSTLNIFNL